MLARADQIEVLALDLIHHGIHVVLAHHALDHVAVDHERRNAEREALVDHKVARVGEHRLVQTGNVAHEIIEARAGDAPGSVHIHAVEALHDLGVIGDLKRGKLRFAEAFDLDVGAVVRTDGNAGVNDVRNEQHDLVDLLLIFRLQLLAFGKPRIVRLDRLHVGIDLCLNGGLFLVGGFFQPAEQRSVCLGQRVAPGAQLACLGDGGAVFRVEPDHLVNEGKLFLLKLLLDVFLDQIGIFPQKLHIKHGRDSLK